MKNKSDKKHSGIKSLSPVYCLLSAVYFLLFISGCTEKESMFKESRILMDTYCTITVVSDTEEKAKEAIEAGFSEIKKLEFLLNYFTEDSEVTAINKAAGEKAVRVSKDTLDIMKKTLKISETTNGAFDPTIAPVIRLWNFSDKKSGPSIPSKESLEKAIGLVDYKNVHINEYSSEIFLSSKGMEIDLGGIAKGYGADRAIEAIKSTGIKAALVAIAGDIRGYGKNTSGKGWKVGIQNPRPLTDAEKPWEDVIASLHLEDMAISTSGDYQRFVIKDGKRYHHILDPETGFPAESDLISVTVIASEGYLSDSISTAVFVLGLKKGMSLIESEGFAAAVVTADKKVIFTANLKGKIEILNNEYSLAE